MFKLSDPKFIKVFRVALFVFATGLYAVTFNHSFNMDDELVTKGHRFVSKGVSGIPDIIKSPYYEDDLGYSYEYRPVTHISFALEHQFFGGTARSGHVLNTLLYGLSCLVMFNLLLRMVPTIPAFAIMAVLLFATHPMHTEVVASIKNRDEILALLFAMLALGQAWQFSLKGAFWRPLMVIALMLMSLLSKSSAASFLFIVPLGMAFLAFHPVRVSVILVAMGLAMGVYIYLRDWPFVWLAIPIVAAFSVVASLILWRLAQGVNWRAVFDWFRPKGWPTTVSERSVIANIGKRDLLLVAVTLLSAIPVLYTGELIYVVVPLSIILFSPYWMGTYSLVGLLLLNGITLPMFVHHYNEAMGLLLLGYMVFVLHNSGRGMLLAASAVAVSFLVGFSEYMHDSERLAVLWQEIDLASQPYLILRFVSLWPIIPLALIYAKRERLRDKGLMRPMMWVLMVLALVAAVQAGSVSSISALVVTVLLYMLLIEKPWPTKRSLELVVAVLIIVVHALASIGIEELYDHSDGTAEKVVAEQIPDSPPVFPPDSSTDGELEVLEDRPLNFVEFPLEGDTTVSRRVGTASVILGHYLKMMFIPWPQAFYYGFDEVPMAEIDDPWSLASIAVHLLLVIVALYFARGHPMFLFGIMAYMASIFLFSNLISPVAGMMGDRLTYVASFGFSVALAYILTMIYQKLKAPSHNKIFVVVFGLLLFVWSGMTIARSTKWKDDLTLMRNDIQTVPRSAQAHNLLASHLMKNSFEPQYAREAIAMRKEAIEHFKQAVRIWPPFFNVWYDIGRASLTINQEANALLAFKETHRLDSTFYDATLNVAKLSERKGDLTQAIEYYRRCIRNNPEMREPYGELSFILFREGRFEESIEVNQQALAQHPDWQDPYLNIARTYEEMGKADKAVEYRERAAKLRR